MTTAALPRSLLHLQFLEANDARPDIVFYRDGFMAAEVERAFPGRGIDLGRETVPRARIADLARARRRNRAYYEGVGRTVAGLGVDRLLLFLEGEPLERFLCAETGIGEVELWEDGLSHYVDLTSGLWYAARGLVQAACGFYPRHITRRRMDRSTVLVRDRFEYRNLVLPGPGPGETLRDAFLFVGSPLVEDRLVPRRRFVEGLGRIADALPLPVRYLPHPRESRERLQGELSALGIALEPDTRGLIAHARAYAYRGYGAAVSTGLLDLGRFERSAYLPDLFGLDRMSRILRDWPHNPVAVISDPAQLAALLARDPAAR